MKSDKFTSYVNDQLEGFKSGGTYKYERIINTPQSSAITLIDGKKVINFCANNYLGLANNQELIKKAQEDVATYGFGMASVRFICGTNQIHKTLEDKISKFLEKEDTILYSCCYDANTGLFETIFTADDAIISDQLNHASVIDGVRLCKAKRFRYKNNDMSDLEARLEEANAAGARFKVIATDGVFSMDGIIANLKGICDLADKYDALVMVDDSHAVGFVGEHGKGTPEYCGVLDRIDIITGTLGKALGGASGGYTSSSDEIVALLRNKSRPYLFSNALAPVITATTMKALELVESGDDLRQDLIRNMKHFRTNMEDAGFDLVPGDHPIIPVMLYDEKKTGIFADKLLDHGIYVIAFSYPVVPKGLARIRTQMSAAHTIEQIDKAIEAFTIVGKEMGVIK